MGIRMEPSFWKLIVSIADWKIKSEAGKMSSFS